MRCNHISVSVQHRCYYSNVHTFNYPLNNVRDVYNGVLVLSQHHKCGVKQITAFPYCFSLFIPTRGAAGVHDGAQVLRAGRHRLNGLGCTQLLQLVKREQAVALVLDGLQKREGAKLQGQQERGDKTQKSSTVQIVLANARAISF